MTALWQMAAVVVWLTLWLATPPSSLGEMGERESFRRLAAPESVASLTNLGQPLGPAPEAAVTVPPTGTQMPPTETQVPPVEPAVASVESHDEKWWRARVTTARDEVEKAQAAAEGLQLRINRLQADAVNLDDPVQQARARRELGAAIVELDRTKEQVVEARKAVAAIQDEARRLNVPPGWIR